MTEQYATNLYSSKHVPESLAAINASKLLSALKYLGDRHVLKTFVQKIDNPPQFVLKGN